jgi:hypothetical protein
VLIENLSVYFLTSQFGTLATVDSQGRATLLTNTWYHVAVTSDGSVKKISLMVNYPEQAGRGCIVFMPELLYSHRSKGFNTS